MFWFGLVFLRFLKKRITKKKIKGRFISQSSSYKYPMILLLLPQSQLCGNLPDLTFTTGLSYLYLDLGGTGSRIKI